jgi:hypothetical protein
MVLCNSSTSMVIDPYIQTLEAWFDISCRILLLILVGSYQFCEYSRYSYGISTYRTPTPSGDSVGVRRVNKQETLFIP